MVHGTWDILSSCEIKLQKVDDVKKGLKLVIVLGRDDERDKIKNWKLAVS